MTTGLRDLFSSERGVFSIALLLASLVLVFTGQMPVGDWIEYSKWLGTAVIASKTVTTAVHTVVNRQPPAATVSPLPTARVVSDQAPSA